MSETTALSPLERELGVRIVRPGMRLLRLSEGVLLLSAMQEYGVTLDTAERLGWVTRINGPTGQGDT
jgi:hypothetical protein